MKTVCVDVCPTLGPCGVVPEVIRRDWAYVEPPNNIGAYAEAYGPFDACEPTMDQALASVEEQLERALADVRSMRAELGTRR